MPGVTLIFSAFERNFVLSLGGEIQKENEDDHKEVVVIESSGETQIQRVGFSANPEYEEDEDDRHHRRSIGPVGGVSRIGDL